MGVANEFFARPEADRLAIVNTNTPHFRGYTRLGMEHTNGVSDWRDQIDIGPEHQPIEIGPDDPAWLRVRGPNQWPPSVPAMEPTMKAWMDRMAVVGDAVLRAIALGLGQPEHFFDPTTSPHPEVLVKVIRYPAQDVAADTGQGVGLHHDSGLVSFILQDDVGGLQVQIGDGLVDATPMPGALVMNIGEMLQIATDGYLRATMHRVQSPPPGRTAGVDRLLLQPGDGGDVRRDRVAARARRRGARRAEHPGRRSDPRELRRQLAEVPTALAPRRRRHAPPRPRRSIRLIGACHPPRVGRVR